MVTFIKGESSKNVDEGSSIIPLLIAGGWTADGYENELDRDALLAKAAAIGIKVHHKSKAETIAKIISEAEKV